MLNDLITFVTGTYNRLAYLQRCIASCRRSVPNSIGLRFVIVDGGSTDGTLEWLRTQTDVTLIEHGQLLGAIRAFDDGARAAVTPYVILGNDDIEILGDSILRALVYLENTPTCAAVAFADNRLGKEYKTQTMAALDAFGKPVHVTYAQVGMFRRELGDLAGWWGSQDPIMGKSRTYAGDNYLSARLWEMGYTVDTVDGVRCNDYIPQDQLRANNQKQTGPGMHPDSAAYYERYPHGPQLPADLQTVNEVERLRVLYLPIFEPGGQHATHRKSKHGLLDALRRRGFAVYEWDYANEPGDVAAIVEAFQPNVMLTQFQGVGNITPELLAKARQIKPDMAVINWNGDAHIENLTGDNIMKLLRHIDLQLVVNAAALPVYERAGMRAHYWQIGYEEPIGVLPVMPAHDVVFLGNCYNEQRREMEIVLRRKSQGVNIGIYGRGWLNAVGDTLYNFGAGVALYQNAKIALADTFPGEQIGFTSNRTFQALAAGAFLLHQHVDRLEEYTGLIAGVHYVEWRNFHHLQTLIHYWLRPENEAERRNIAAQGQTFVRARYSFDALLNQLFDEILPGVFVHEPV